MALRISSLVVCCTLFVLLQGCLESGTDELRKPALLKENSGANVPDAVPTLRPPAAIASSTPLPRPTQVPATSTSIPIPTSTPAPTQTPIPTTTPTQTHTPLPTGTPTPSQTATHTPVVTATATPPVCGYAQLVLIGAGKDHDPCYTPTPTP